MESGSKRIHPNANSLIPRSLKNNNEQQDFLCDTIHRLFYRTFNTAGDQSVHWTVKYSPVSTILQKGPTCGLVAVVVAAKFFQKTFLETNLTDDRVLESHEPSKLLALAQKNGFTWKGEMFSAQHLADIATQAYGLKAEVATWDSHEQILRHLDQGGLCLVAYDKDGNNEPCLKNGHKAHWTLINGYAIANSNPNHAGSFTYEATQINVRDTSTGENVASTPNVIKTVTAENILLLCVHGKTVRQCVWMYDRLFESTHNLQRVQPSVYENRQTDNNEGYVVPKDGDLSASLAGKVVFLFR
ncbi:hypothetical protein HDU76_005805 [Blyttiomyces sp. JEL0837]|nr:hypothetical protein HDU76_005805 [Blyttiomyces sp. JEL0837]